MVYKNNYVSSCLLSVSLAGKKKTFGTKISFCTCKEDPWVWFEAMLFDWLTWIPFLMNTSRAVGKVNFLPTQTDSSSISHITALLSAVCSGNGGGKSVSWPFSTDVVKILLWLKRLQKSIKWRFYMHCRSFGGNAGGIPWEFNASVN